jgi:dTDP-4-dehydrorhamnose 3,5-epimerase-like enzyme
MKFEMIQVATSDARGTISDVIYKGNFQHAAVIETFIPNDGTPVIRGNHYHKFTTQSVLILDGELIYWYQPVDKSDRVKCITVPKNGLVTSGPNEIHAMEIRQDTRFIVFTDGPRGGADYESDTFRVDPIIPPIL